MNYLKKTGKFTDMWRLNNMLLNNRMSQEEIKNISKQTKMEIQQNFWNISKASLREKFTVINAIGQETRKIS